jgi:hypothetical protein
MLQAPTIHHMDVEEMQALTRSVEVLPPVGLRAAHPVLVMAYNDLLSRFRRNAFLAVNRLAVGRPVEAERADDLRSIARTLSDMRQRVGANAEDRPVTTATRARDDAPDP